MTRKFGSRSEVMDGLCVMTRGGLAKDDLMLNTKTGKIVSKKKSELAKQNYSKFGFNKRATDDEKIDEPKKKCQKKKRKKKKKLVKDE